MSFSLFGLFGAGVLTFLSPCVLPLVPVLTASFLLSSEASRWTRLRSTLWFVVGFTMIFVLMGVSLGALSAQLGALKPVLLVVAGVILALFGAKMAGLIDTSRAFAWMDRSLHLPDWRGKVPAGLHGLVFGMLFGLSWTPCVGPVLGGVLTYVASGQNSTLESAAMLTAFALGIGLPLIAFALTSDSLMPALNRFKRHLPKVEYVSGIGLLIFGVYIVGQARFQLPHFFQPGSDSQGVVAVSDRGEKYRLDDKASRRARMVFFYSEHCPVCHAMDRYLPEFEQNCSSENFELIRVNIDDPRNYVAASTFKVKAVPTVALMNDQGAEVVHLVGYQTEGRLRDAAKTVTQLVCQTPLQDPATNHGGSEPVLDQACDVGSSC